VNYALFKLITTLVLQITLARVLKCCKILMVMIYLTCLITVNHGLLCCYSLESNADFDINKYYKQRLIMSLHGNAVLFYSSTEAKEIT
jgi:hypothetical protein